MAKNKQSNLIAFQKNAEHDFHYKILALELRGGYIQYQLIAVMRIKYYQIIGLYST